MLTPPRAGRTTLLRDLRQAIHAANPDTIMMVLLVDERPEEVSLQEAVTAEPSTFDEPLSVTQVSEMVIER